MRRWRPFVFFFRKHWGDCPFPVFLIVNRLRVCSNFLEPIRVGPDRDWAGNMQVALRQVSQPYILYLQEDYFLNGPVHREQLAADFAYAFEQDAASFCFYGRSQLEPDFRKLSDGGIVPQIPTDGPGFKRRCGKRGPRIRAATGRNGLEHGSAGERANTRPPRAFLHGTRERSDPVLDVGHFPTALDPRSNFAVPKRARSDSSALSAGAQRCRVAPAATARYRSRALRHRLGEARKPRD